MVIILARGAEDFILMRLEGGLLRRGAVGFGELLDVADFDLVREIVKFCKQQMGFNPSRRSGAWFIQPEGSPQQTSRREPRRDPRSDLVSIEDWAEMASRHDANGMPGLAREVDAAVLASLVRECGGHGMVSKCAWCGAVKLPSGEWKQTKDHIDEGVITHGICPKCEDGLMGEIRKRKNV